LLYFFLSTSCSWNTHQLIRRHTLYFSHIQSIVALLLVRIPTSLAQNGVELNFCSDGPYPTSLHKWNKDLWPCDNYAAESTYYPCQLIELVPILCPQEQEQYAHEATTIEIDKSGAIPLQHELAMLTTWGSTSSSSNKSVVSTALSKSGGCWVPTSIPFLVVE
jgi:hypothetical protein